MDKHFAMLRQTRANMIKLVESCTIEQLNTVPDTFRNNIIWNFAHSIASTQGLTYGRLGMKMNVPVEKMVGFRKGDVLDRVVSQEEISYWINTAKETLDILDNDYTSGKLVADYNQYETSYGYTINVVEEAIPFCVLHEALHFGYMMAQKHLV